MKKDTHPKDYRLVAFKDMSNSDVFLTKSTANTSETIEHEGVEYPLVKMEISRKLYQLLILLKSFIFLKGFFFIFT